MTPAPTPLASAAAVREAFAAVVELTPGLARDKALEALRLRGEPVWREVVSLLQHLPTDGETTTGAPTARPNPDARSGSGALTLSKPALAQMPGLNIARPALMPGHILGAWQITSLMGKGGMGEVYEARRADGSWDGLAAVKVLSPGQGDGSFMQRFLLERQALATLDHPNVARLLDAGTTADGLPYLVMEHVGEARTISRATADEPLPVRLELLVQLASALAHSHASMLLHCDVKPSNVLVDRRGRVRLLDFGIAKALREPGPGRPEATATAVGSLPPMTPRYASPEQLRGERVGVASDIYSFGALAYEVLTRSHPTSPPNVSAAEAVAATLTRSPPAASTVVPAGARVSAAQLRGDLDAILAKALEKQAAHRYSSMAAVAADLSAVLEGRPISLRATQAGYVLVHLVRRHRGAALALGLGLLGLLTGLGAALLQGQWGLVLGAGGMAAGLGVALQQARRADQAQARAERRLAEVRRLGTSLFIDHHHRIAELPGAVAARAALLADGERYLEAMASDGPPDAGLARELAEGYLRLAVLQGEPLSPSLADAGRAEVSLTKALDLQPLYLGRPDTPAAALPAAADMHLLRATLCLGKEDVSASLAALDAAHHWASAAVGPGEGNAQAVSRLASVEGRRALALGGSVNQACAGRWRDAEPELRRASGRLEGLYLRAPAERQWPHELAWALALWANYLTATGRPEEAAQAATRSVTLRDEAALHEPANVHLQYQRATARMSRAVALVASGRFAQGLEQQEQACELLRTTAAGDPGNRAAAGLLVMIEPTLFRSLVLAGRHDEARQRLPGLLGALPHRSEGAFDRARTRSDGLCWAAELVLNDQPEQALAWAQEAEELMQVPPDDARRANAARLWAWARAAGQHAQALQACGQTAAAAQQSQLACALWPVDPLPMMARWRDRDLALRALLA